MSAHSPVGASNAKRWMNCPGSVQLCRDIPSTSSVYAEEGTRAHAVAETLLLDLPVDAVEEQLPADMLPAVQVYVDYVNSLRADGYDVYLEQRLDLAAFHPELEGCFGTADCVAYRADLKHLYVVDYKHGKGIAVPALGNPQLRYYALGAIAMIRMPVEAVTMVIVQPRASGEPIRVDSVDRVALDVFAVDLRAAVKRTKQWDAPLNPGDWCQFCPAHAVCPEVTRIVTEAVAVQFSPSALSSPDALAKALESLPIVEAWASAMRDFAFQQANTGVRIPGYKLVEKRANRSWKSEGQTVMWLQQRTKLNSHDYYDMKLKSPAALEKIVGKDLKAELTELVTKESSGLTLAPATDPRPEVMAGVAAEFSSALLD